LDVIRAIAIVLVSAGVAALATPGVMRLALAVGAVDRPNERKVSRRFSMPLLGGLAVGIGCGAGLLLETLWGGGPAIWPKAGGFVLGGALLMAVGFVDDRFVLRASVKFTFQLIAAAIAIQAGFRVDLFSDPLTVQTYAVPLWFMLPISLVWIVGVTNAMNLIDGLDGLSSGLGAIIAATLTIICWQADQWVGVVIGLSLFGALIGYLPFNFPPARIFLGDTGSLLIGFSLAVLALEGYRKAAFLAFIVPILALAIPLLDTLLSIARRIRSGRSMFSPDKLHMHHRLLLREGSHKNAVLMLYFLTGCFCMIAISFAQIDGWLAFVYLAAVVAVTIRLLRNLDAFSLEVPVPPAQKSPEEAPPAAPCDNGEKS
jgi:UDP-GlcNAc:undecaprenyl-phosphate/decaprenyl-phosphate GlcNAc-1-phosphate transferase